MHAYVKKHEEYILNQMREGKIDVLLLTYHQMELRHLQHERLIHLLVLFLFSILFFASFVLLYVRVSLMLMILFLILLVLEAFYVCHYFFLENHVQKWYLYENTMNQKLYGKGANLSKEVKL